MNSYPDTWPGTDIPRSPDNCFTQTYSGNPIDWAALDAARALSAKRTENLRKMRGEGRCLSFEGIAKKAGSRK